MYVIVRTLPFLKGGIRYFKNGCWGRWKVFTRNGGRGRGTRNEKGGWGWGLVYNGGMENFFWRTPAPTVLSIALFLWLNGWSRHNWCTILPNDNMDLYMSSFGTLVPEEPWYVLYARGVKFTEIWHIRGPLRGHTGAFRGQ